MKLWLPSPVWWWVPVLPALGRWRQEDQKLKVIVGYNREFETNLGGKGEKFKRGRERVKVFSYSEHSS